MSVILRVAFSSGNTKSDEISRTWLIMKSRASIRLVAMTDDDTSTFN
jgi:hypothetical protein